MGCPPFWHRKQMVMLRNIMEGRYSFTSPEWADISGIQAVGASMALLRRVFDMFVVAEDPKDLIRRLLVVDPAQRIALEDALTHQFFHTKVCDVTHHTDKVSILGWTVPYISILY